jgi:hypothetical protein
MGKQYQTSAAEASTPQLTIPAEVSVALAEIAESAKEGLLALAVGAGLQVLGTLMEESVVAVAGPKGKHNPDRAAVRHGHEHGSVTLGGGGLGSSVPGCGPPAARVSFRWPPTSCLRAPSCWAGWRWSGCWVGCRRAATVWAWSRSAAGWSRPPRRPRSRRCRASLSP